MGGKKWKSFMSKLYGWGATIVIVGAMFKIQHWPFASEMLVLGLSIEAVIFFFSAFEPPHEEIDWSLVYPELAGMHDDAGTHLKAEEEPAPAHEDKGAISVQLDKMLEEAKIGPELIESLGTGFKNFSDQASKLNNITDAGVASDEFANTLKSASQTVDNLSLSYGKAKDVINSSTEDLAKSYSKASQAMESLAISNEESQVYGQELTKVSKNLSALNAMYELQLQGTRDHLQSVNKLFDGMGELMQNLSDSVADTKKYKDEISTLSENLSALNGIYGNMLNAMNFRK